MSSVIPVYVMGFDFMELDVQIGMGVNSNDHMIVAILRNRKTIKQPLSFLDNGQKKRKLINQKWGYKSFYVFCKAAFLKNRIGNDRFRCAS